MKTYSKSLITLLICLLVISTLAVSSAFANGPTVTPGYEPSAILKGAVRYKSLNSGPGGEIYLGKPDLGSPGNRVENDFYRGKTCEGAYPYGSWQPSNHVTFSYDPVAGKVYSIVNASHNYCLEYTVGDVGALNYIQIAVVSRKDGATVALNNVTLDGTPLGNFSGSGWSTWNVTGVDLTSGFTIAGDLVLTGTQPGGELNKVEISVGHFIPPNEPPVCTGAYASVDTIWPPNHKFIAVDVLGVTDPDGDPVTITVDSIYQDEPVDDTGDGAFAPDGVGVGTATAEVRAERDGAGNGRFYHIGFTADDGNGGTCTGEVLVGVPKSQGKDGAPVDDGALYDSTVP